MNWKKLRANIEFNKGIEAGHLRTLTFIEKNSTITKNQLNYPGGNSKEFCSGWKFIAMIIKTTKDPATRQAIVEYGGLTP